VLQPALQVRGSWLEQQDAAAQWVRSWWRAQAFYNARHGRSADPSPMSFRSSVKVDHAEPSPIGTRFTADDDEHAAITLIALTEVRR